MRKGMILLPLESTQKRMKQVKHLPKKPWETWDLRFVLRLFGIAQSIYLHIGCSWWFSVECLARHVSPSWTRLFSEWSSWSRHQLKPIHTPVRSQCECSFPCFQHLWTMWHVPGLEYSCLRHFLYCVVLGSPQEGGGGTRTRWFGLSGCWLIQESQLMKAVTSHELSVDSADQTAESWSSRERAAAGNGAEASNVSQHSQWLWQTWHHEAGQDRQRLGKLQGQACPELSTAMLRLFVVYIGHRKPTWNRKMNFWPLFFLFQGVIFRFHVNS